MREHDYAAQERADRRLECLKLAQAAENPSNAPTSVSRISVLYRAAAYADFVNGPAAETTEMPAPGEDGGDAIEAYDPTAPAPPAAPGE